MMKIAAGVPADGYIQHNLVYGTVKSACMYGSLTMTAILHVIWSLLLICMISAHVILRKLF